MAKSFQLIVPTILETETTGFAGAVEKTFRGALYRVEIWPSAALTYALRERTS